MQAKHYRIPKEQLLKFNQLVLQNTGLLFADKKRYDLERGIMTVLNKSAYKDLNELYLALCRKEPVFDELISELTVGETYFYRDENQFSLLKKEILPAIIKQAKTSKQLKIWSAGCATGEEPYTVAILLKELLPGIKEWDILILATDINKKALAKAKAGVYNDWSFRALPPNWLSTYFQEIGKKSYRLKEEIKSLVTFNYLNLKDNLYPSFFNQTFALDLIICRNVTIYLQPEVTESIFGRFEAALKPGGWLMLGASDPTPNKFNLAIVVKNGTFVYRKNKEKQPLLPAALPAKSKIAPTPAKEAPPLKEKKEFYQAEAATAATKSTAGAYGNLNPSVTATTVKPSARQLLQDASKMLAANKLKEAESLLKQYLAAHQTDAKAYFLLGLVNEVNENIETAHNCLKKAVFLQPDYLEAHFILANVYKKLQEEKKARLHFQKVIKLTANISNLKQIVPGTNGLTYAHLKEVAEIELVKGAEHVH
jgi:chemotaxis protein methyltransferase CheR